MAEWAEREDRIVVTEDYDFGEMTIRKRISVPGVIIIGMGTASVADRIERLRDVIAQSGASLLGHLAVVETGRLRLRPLAV